MIHLPTMDLHKLFAGGCFFHLSSILFSQRTGHSDSPKHWFRSTQTCTECLTGNFREKKNTPRKRNMEPESIPPLEKKNRFQKFQNSPLFGEFMLFLVVDCVSLFPCGFYGGLTPWKHNQRLPSFTETNGIDLRAVPQVATPRSCGRWRRFRKSCASVKRLRCVPMGRHTSCRPLRRPPPRTWHAFGKNMEEPFQW